ncbi:hypothetical protein [Vreelandella nanhaiensis]|uniref:Sulfotransferase domain-containing protein n=1 Tax=Vreelandella nanhaiensis TaxID=1258546 RepID=A0A433KJS7_9GAMM|nr:hypothetical protein [Halomonas nanhaiensis]RUR29982.1 hypothetical protein ELY38_14135 [Halomonas nanhaiensis]
MKFKKCVLHIGIEKTGSTTIQRFLEKNREALIDQGHYYPKSLGPCRGSHYYLVVYSRHEDVYDDLRLISGVSNKEELYSFRRKLENEIEQEFNSLEGGRTLHISCENFHSRLHGIPAIEKVKKLLSPYVQDFQVLCYLRPQHEVALSLYSTDMKLGGLPKSPLPKVDSNNHYYNYFVMLEKWRHVFGSKNLEIRLFDRENLYDNDLIKDYMYTTGLRNNNLISIEKENESLSLEGLELLGELNKYLPRFEGDKPTGYRKNIAECMEKIFPGKGATIKRKSAEDFYHQFEESNNQVAKKYLSKSKLFFPRFLKYPEDESYFNDVDESVFILLSHIIPIYDKKIVLNGISITLPIESRKIYQNYKDMLRLYEKEKLLSFVAQIWKSNEFKST